jgi:hypothetical protein
MRLSIWQQFSSNHSSHFWIPGTFRSAEETDAAYHTLRDRLLEIDQWHREHPEESRDARMYPRQPPISIEKALSQQYHVEWTRTLDWMNVAHYLDLEGLDQRLNWVLNVVGRSIVIADPGETFNGVQPFDTLLARLGATGVIGYDLAQQEAGTAPTYV